MKYEIITIINLLKKVPGGRFYDRPAIIIRRPRVTVSVRIDAHRGFDSVIDPEDRRVCKYIILRKDILRSSFRIWVRMLSGRSSV